MSLRGENGQTVFPIRLLYFHCMMQIVDFYILVGFDTCIIIADFPRATMGEWGLTYSQFSWGIK